MFRCFKHLGRNKQVPSDVFCTSLYQLLLYPYQVYQNIPTYGSRVAFLLFMSSICKREVTHVHR